MALRFGAENVGWGRLDGKSYDSQSKAIENRPPEKVTYVRAHLRLLETSFSIAILQVQPLSKGTA